MAAKRNRPSAAANDRADEEIPLEAPEADAVDQYTALDDDDVWPPDVSFGVDVPEADATDQAREVPEDEDDYR